MNNYQYQSHNKPPKKRGLFSYVLVAIIAGIIGGIISAYIAPTYLYGKLIPIPDLYVNNTQSSPNEIITITPIASVDVVTAVARKAVSSVVGITSVQLKRELFWTKSYEGVGSGVVVHSNGYILTNSHVIGDGKGKDIKVLFENQEQMDGKVLWFDPALDLAVIKVNASGIQAADLGNSDLLEVGQLAVAIGNPLGLDFQRTVTSGVISGLHRSIKVDEFNVIEDLIQTDASINPGNSGGPLLNSMGEVIGINTAKIQTGEGLGFSIPINSVKPIVKEVVENGKFNNVYIGFQGRDVAVYERQYGVKLKSNTGIVILEILPNSPAASTELKPLDIILKLDNEPTESMTNLRKLLYNYRVGDKATLTINRDGKELKIEIKFNNF